MEPRAGQSRGWHEHFLGGLRVNCESVPRLPAGAVRRVLDDPRKIPYLFLWRRDDRGEIVEAVRVAVSPGGHPPVRPGEEWVSVTRPPRTVGYVHALRVLRRTLPRHGGEALSLVCPGCNRPRLYLYAWEVSGSRVVPRPWHCRTCSGLRYQSEGTYNRFPDWGGYPRPDTWDPYVFSSLEEALELR